MNKKMIISIVFFVLAVLLLTIIWSVFNNNTDEKIEINEAKSEFEIDGGNDDEDVVQPANIDLSEDTTRYLLKNVDNYIYVYYLDDDNKETLYRKTDIFVDYLSQEDIDNLDVGIEVTGIEELNKLIEDFE